MKKLLALALVLVISTSALAGDIGIPGVTAQPQTTEIPIVVSWLDWLWSFIA